jgi:hypothetical protein
VINRPVELLELLELLDPHDVSAAPINAAATTEMTILVLLIGGPSIPR